MKCLGPVGLLIVSLSLCQSLPSEVTTSRYTNEGKISLNVVKFSILPDFNQENYSNTFLPYKKSKLLSTFKPKSPKSAHTPPDEILLKEFIRKNAPELNLSNKSIEIVTVHKVLKNTSELILNNTNNKLKIVNASTPIFIEDIIPLKNNSKVIPNNNKLNIELLNNVFNSDLSIKDNVNIPNVNNISLSLNTSTTTNKFVDKNTIIKLKPQNIQTKSGLVITNIPLGNLQLDSPVNLFINDNTTNVRKVVTIKPNLAITTRRPLINKITETKPPFRIKLTKVWTTAQPARRTSPPKVPNNKGNVNRIRKPQIVRSTTLKPKSRRPSPNRKVIKRPTLNNFKQNWADVPIPNPMPEISSHSPSFSLADLSNDGVLDDSVFIDAPPLGGDGGGSQPLQNPLNTFTLSMLPDGTKQGTAGEGIGCPTVHIASSVLNAAPPQLRQECSDLNLVINSHIHQNSVTDRTPLSPLDVETYDNEAEAVEADDVGAAAVEDEAPLADPAGAATNSVPGAAGGTGGSGGSGGNGGGQNPLSGFNLPDLKGLGDILKWLGEGLAKKIKFFMNPYLYIIPIALFFTLGFLFKMALFPWWIPFLLLFLGIKSNNSRKKTSNVTFYKHAHKPVHHPDGWFWNHQTKTWQNVADYLHHRRVGYDEGAGEINPPHLSNIPVAIRNFAEKHRQMVKDIEWRSAAIGDTIKQLTNQLMEVNATSAGVMTFDTRTPPKVKQQQKIKKEPMENSHAGVAIPIEPDELEAGDKIEETTKKLNFYKIERPTTNGGLSTWILLSGQSSTTKAPKKPPALVKPIEQVAADIKNMTAVVTAEAPPRIIKPLFKKRTTTRKPVTVKNATESIKVSIEAGKSSTTTSKPKVTITTTAASKLTKVKATMLKNALNKKNTTTAAPSKKTTATNLNTSTTAKPNQTSTSTVVSVIKNSTDSPIKLLESNELPAEAKEGETDLSDKKKKSVKRKKNKTRRRKPAADKSSNSTKIAKQKIAGKEKPIGTQLYNYLSREVMPTVGVGMVGLLVTAGLASYFLYPFGVARRSYEIDRRDKEGAYYYNDYAGGIAEEEAIGKVIAGMPSNSIYGSNAYKTPSSRNAYSNVNVRYRQVDRRSQQAQQAQQSIQEKIDQVQLTTKKPPVYENSYVIPQNYQSDTYQPVTYNLNEDSKEKYEEESKFVVGNIPKELNSEATPVSVPEHGPRSLRIRRKRSKDIENEIDNEINDLDKNGQIIKNKLTTKQEETTTTTTTESFTTEKTPDKVVSFFDLLKDVFHMKLHLGLQLIKNATQTVNTYVTKVQSRLDEHYRNYTEQRNKNIYH
ncbi:unnamed protein product [Brassicogethes aeneus]|uniref:Uncharacterized protein n=1 Tax=Brassicogethes aeneus TaxID=1431903 RepID=A0A9P0B9K2_BRAAE|nr:unnamed protein product [Brassicogethes aeneus]